MKKPYIKLLFFFIGVLTFFSNFSHTQGASLQFSPSTGTVGMYCNQPINILLDTQGISARAIDVKIFFDENQLSINNITGYLSYGTYFPSSFSLLQGFSLQAVNYGWKSYTSSSPYFYINWSDTSFQSGSTPFAGFWIKSTGTTLTGLLDFYMISGANYDDSNIQSGIVNKFIDALTSVNSGFYNFIPKPCIIDQQAPIITGFQSISGQEVNIQTNSGFTILIYDRIGNTGDSYQNSTFHYRFQSGNTTLSNLINYVPVGGNLIDNQNGINTGTLQIVASGSIGTGLLSPTQITGFDCSLPYNGPGNPLTRNRNLRGIQCFIPLTSLPLQSNQTVQFSISVQDNPNSDGNYFTGYSTFTTTITGILTSGMTQNLIIAWPEKRSSEAVTYTNESGTILTTIYNNQSPASFNALKNFLFIPGISGSVFNQFITTVNIQEPSLTTGFETTWYQLYTSGTGGETQLPRISGYNNQNLISTGNTPPNLRMEGTIEFVTTGTKQLVKTGYIMINHLGYGIMTGTLLPGTYDIGFKSTAHLRRILRNITIGGTYHIFDFTSGGNYFLKAGDFYSDNMVNDIDLSTLLGDYLSGVRLTDITLNGQVNDIDLSVLLGNYLMTGDSY